MWTLRMLLEAVGSSLDELYIYLSQLILFFILLVKIIKHLSFLENLIVFILFIIFFFNKKDHMTSGLSFGEEGVEDS